MSVVHPVPGYLAMQETAVQCVKGEGKYDNIQIPSQVGGDPLHPLNPWQTLLTSRA